ncbi:hypothetical protein [Nitrososphaera sp.]|nr:hypothetical protein [Nitrososphaera sp.]
MPAAEMTTMTVPRTLRDAIAERGKAGESLADVLRRELGIQK